MRYSDRSRASCWSPFSSCPIRKVLDHRDKVYEQLAKYLQLRNVIERLQVKTAKVRDHFDVFGQGRGMGGETPDQNLSADLKGDHWPLPLFPWPHRKLTPRSYICRWIWAVTSSLTQLCECLPAPLSPQGSASPFLHATNIFFWVFAMYQTLC